MNRLSAGGGGCGQGVDFVWRGCGWGGEVVENVEGGETVGGGAHVGVPTLKF